MGAGQGWVMVSQKIVSGRVEDDGAHDERVFIGP
jgi:hypothetical protein